MSGLMDKVKAKAEQVLHKDKNNNNVDSDGYGVQANNPTSSYGDNTTGGAYAGTTTTGGGYDNPQSTNAGPHSSNLANKVDPRVDSDMDNRNDPTSRVGGYGTQDRYGGAGANPMPGSGNTGGAYGGSTTTGAYDNTTTGGLNDPTTGGYGNNPSTGGYDNPQSTNVGPHSSNLANKMDPRVDSDMDNRNNPTSRVGGYGTQDNYGASGANPSTGSSGYGGQTTGIGGQNTGFGDQTTGYGGQTGGGLAAQSGGYDNPQSSNLGPHSSNLANKVDPRVDSDGDNRNNPTSRVGGYGAQDNYGTTGANPTVSSNYGGNTGGIDNRYGGNPGGFDNNNPQSAYQSTTTGGNYGDNLGSSATPGSGNASNTAGPHNSNLLNKIDPRVDSDMDGSKTYGGNQTNA